MTQCQDETRSSGAWQGVVRSDGVLIVQTFMGNFIVLPADEAPAIDRCPDCGDEIRSLEDARCVADQCLPLPFSMTTENDMPENADQGCQNGKC